MSEKKASVLEVFWEFLIIGATSFGGGVVAYLRGALVRKKQWFSDEEFLEIMSISNTLPGLNATNVAILAGDRLCGPLGSIVAMLGMCLPAFAFMVACGIAYGSHVDRPGADAALKGVAAAAVGMLACTWFQIGKKSLRGFYDAAFVIAAILGINYFKLGVPVTLLAVGALAIFTFRPKPPKPAAEVKAEEAEETEEWISSLH